MGGLAAVGALVAIRAASPGPSHASAAPVPAVAQSAAPVPQPAEQPKPVTTPAREPPSGAGRGTAAAADAPREASHAVAAAAPPVTDHRPPAARSVRRDRTARDEAHPDVARDVPRAATNREAAAPEMRPRSADPEDGFIFK